MEIVVCDLDDTLRSTAHRHKCCPWCNDSGLSAIEFFEMGKDDPPITGTVKLLRMLYTVYPVHIMTMVPLDFRTPTAAWLARYDVRYDQLHMLGSEAGHYTTPDISAATLKTAKIKEILADGRDELALFIDDLKSTCDAVAELGPVLHVRAPACDDADCQCELQRR
jgi:hypothetical protein